jgi:hypothetical protein
MHPSSDVVAWLLEPSEPSICYWSLTKLLGRSDADTEVQNARRAITDYGPAAAILSHYDTNGKWEGERSCYTRKYTSTHWQLLLLSELAADGTDNRIADACQRMIEEISNEERDTIWPCFHGNLVGYLHALGQAQDPRVAFFEAELAATGTRGQWCCPISDDRPCTWGAARALWGFSQMAPSRRNHTVEDAMSSAIELLASRGFGLTDRSGDPPRHKLWDRLTFPLFYQADILFILRTLADLEYLDTVPNASDALLWLEAKGRGNSQWNGTCPYTSRMWTQLESHRHPSKWIT